MTVKARAIAAMQFKPSEWCAVFTADYISGAPRSDNYENSEVLLITAREAVERGDITNMSRGILTAYMRGAAALTKSDYLPKAASAGEYVIFGI